MKEYILIILISFQVLAAGAQDKQIPVYNFEQFKPMLHLDNDTVYVINFWATWCRPCVEELPYFEQLNENYSSEKVKVILVSLDFADELNSRVIPFLERRKIQSEVIILDESDPNVFIDQVSTQWSGAIPATIVYKGSESDFYERNFNYEELESVVELKLF